MKAISDANPAKSQANLLASRNFSADAEATYKLASEIFPRSTETVMSYANFLSNAGRLAEARQTLSEFERRNPDLTTHTKPETDLVY